MSSKQFASQADLVEKQVTFEQLSEHAWAYTAEGDPNTGIVIGDDAVLVADTQATPAMAQDVIRRIRQVTDKPIRYVVLTHYHAVRVLGASAYGAQQVIASEDTYDLIVERGEADKASEIGETRLPAGMSASRARSFSAIGWPVWAIARSNWPPTSMLWMPRWGRPSGRSSAGSSWSGMGGCYRTVGPMALVETFVHGERI